MGIDTDATSLSGTVVSNTVHWMARGAPFTPGEIRLPISASAHFGQLRTVRASTRKLKAAVHWQLRTDGSHANRHGPALLIQDCVGAHARRLAASNPSEDKISEISNRPCRALLSECILRVITA